MKVAYKEDTRPVIIELDSEEVKILIFLLGKNRHQGTEYSTVITTLYNKLCDLEIKPNNKIRFRGYPGYFELLEPE